MSQAERVDALVRQLTEARQAYYQSVAPIMSDQQFDALEDELRLLNPDHGYFSQVGVPPEGDDAVLGMKIRHRLPMLSMGKAQNPSEVTKWLTRLQPDRDWSLCVQPKIDGVSASLFYDKGHLVHVATRGDGHTGYEIGHVAGYVEDIPTRIGFTKHPVEVRGELHLPRDTAFDTGDRPLRNNCVGLIKRKEGQEDIRHIRFLAYQIIWPHNPPGTAKPEGVIADRCFDSEFEKIDVLSKHGFYTFQKWQIHAVNTAEDVVLSLGNQIEKIYIEYLDTLRDRWNFETDGLIIVVDDNRLHNEIDSRWVVDHHHHYALALKPPPQSATTVLKSISWQVSRHGVLTPVAVFEPIRLGGAILERASLHNADNVCRLKLATGDRIVVERANDVIPYVRSNTDGVSREDGFRDDAIWPERCPCCAGNVKQDGVNIICSNRTCRQRLLQALHFWTKQSGMEHIALKTLETLYDLGKLRTIKDLYGLKQDDFEGMAGFGDKKISNFMQQIHQARTMSAVELISRLGIPMVQKKSLLNLGIRTIDDFLNFDDQGYVIGKRIIEWKEQPGNMDMLSELLQVIEVVDQSAEDQQDIDIRGAVCLTGKAPVSRKTLEDALEESGWQVQSSITGQTDILVCEDVNGQSSKLKKAREAGIPIVSYQQFIDDNGLRL